MFLQWDFFQHFVEDIDEFSKVKDIPADIDWTPMARISERAFKTCLCDPGRRANQRWGRGALRPLHPPPAPARQSLAMSRHFSDGIGVLAAVITILGGVIATHQYLQSDLGKPLMTWLSADTLRLIVILVLLLLPWLAIWKAWALERRLTRREASDMEIKRLVELLQADLAVAQVTLAGLVPRPIELAENELLHEGVVWSWNGHDAQGPRCPQHKEPLVYQNFLLVSSTEDFEEPFLGGAGWFLCPVDKERFRVDGNVRVGQLRAQAAGRFRVKYRVS